MPRQRLQMVKTCVQCGERFHPYDKRRKCCSALCAARYRAEHYPSTFASMRAANEGKRRDYAKQLGQKLRGMTPGEIWRMAYHRGYTACWQRVVRGQANPRRVSA